MTLHHITLDVDVVDADGGYTIPAQLTIDQHVTYEPYIGGRNEVGFRAVHADGRVEYLYLNPSYNPDGSDVPNVFLYQGDSGDPAYDGAVAHFLPFS